MRISDLSSGADINKLKALLASGAITQDDLSQANISGSFGSAPQNALAGLVQPQNTPPPESSFGISDAQRGVGREGGPQFGDLDHELQGYSDHPQTPQDKMMQDALLAQKGDPDAMSRIQRAIDGGQGAENYGALPPGNNFVKNETTGLVTYLTPQGQSDRPSYGSTIQSFNPPPGGAGYTGAKGMIASNAGPQQMNVIGAGNGSVVQLTPEAYKAPQLAPGRNPIDIPGVGRGYYGTDGNAYVKNDDGSMTKVILGYDRQGSMALNKYNQDMAKGQAEIAHTQEQTRASQVNNPDFSGGMGGDVGSVDAGTAATVKAMVEGRMAPPSGAALRSPRTMQLINLANQVDPSFDAATWKRRADTASEFAHGKSFQSVNALNTVAGHLDQFDQAVDKLNNTNYPLVNAVVNPVEQALGGTKQTDYQTVLKTLAPELERAYRGAGGSEGSIEQWRNALSGNNGYEQQKSAIRTLAGLLHSKIDALGQSYSQGMNKSSTGYDLLSPDAQRVFSKFTGMNEAPQGASPQAQAPQARPTSFPKIGEVQNGYRYRGGDPGNKVSWEKV